MHHHRHLVQACAGLSYASAAVEENLAEQVDVRLRVPGFQVRQRSSALWQMVGLRWYPKTRQVAKRESGS